MSAQKTKASGVLGAVLGIIGMSAIAGILVTALVAPALAVTGLAANNSIGMFENLPSYIEPTALAQKSEIYAKGSDGTDMLLAGVYDQNREEVGWDQVSQYVKDAVIAVEDPRFYSHGGVDIASATRAALQNAASGEGPGASTISMQYVRNIQIQKTNEIADPAAQQKAFAEATAVTIDRKLKEMKLAIGLEKEFTKDQILLGYLNISNFGGTIYGIESAAQYYYGVHATDVTVAQAASLVSMVNEPNGLRIDEPENIPDNQARRDKDVLPAMLKYHKITKAQFDEAVATPVVPNIQTPSTGCQTANPIGGGFFCDYVSHIIKNDPTFGETEDARWEKFKTGGYKIYTTLDWDLQIAAQDSMSLIPKTPEAAGFDVGSSMVTVQPNTGRVLAMVQNKDYNAEDGAAANESSVNYSTDFDYGGSSGFQQGSTYKVFTLAEWLKNGHSLGDIVQGNSRPFNLSTFKNSCQGGYGSQIYQSANDSGEAPGNITVSRATAESVNNAFISMAQKLDMCEITKTAEAFGEHRADGNPMEQNVSGVLGTNEVAPLSVAAAYAGIANGGKYCSPVAIDKIIDATGAEVPVPQTTCNQAVPANVAATMAQAMKGVVNGGTGGSANPNDGIPLIGKTGTTDGEISLWFAGATTALATAIWTGNVQGYTSLRHTYIDGVGNAGEMRFPVWKSYMLRADTKYPGGDFAAPDSSLLHGVQVTIPDLKGTPVPDAEQKLDDIGFDFTDGGVVDSDAPAGTVASTDPAAGTSVTKGSTVTVYTSNGLLKPIPSIVGKSLNDAANTLTGSPNGFRLGATKTIVDPKCGDPNKAIGTEPAVGTPAKAGDTVVIVMCKKQ
jgi:membrane peptidoglycan carboxypeptidase